MSENIPDSKEENKIVEDLTDSKLQINIDSLQDTLNSERKNYRADIDDKTKKNAELQETLSHWQELNISPDDIKALLQKNEQSKPVDVQTILDRERAEKNAQKKKYDAAIAKSEVKIKELNASIDKTKLISTIKTAAEKAGVRNNLMDDVINLTINQVKLGDNKQVIVVDSDGYDRNISLDEYFDKEYRVKRPEYFEKLTARGTGMNKNDLLINNKPISRKLMKPEQKSAYISKYGHEEFMKLPT